MQKEIFFTEEEMQIIRVCLHNAPIPYDQGEGAKKLKALQEKTGPPISREEPGISKVKYDLTPYGIYDDE
tara:strand:+ start:103 stop:312 length:210 start_codon:yes stop_codon:yes gene_type:complete